MRFLANENFPLPSIKLLREQGFYVKAIADDNAGVTDKDVINIAIEENLIILTFDKDYGEIIFRYSINIPPSVVFFRHKGNDPFFAGNYLINLIYKEQRIITGSFTVVEEFSYRQRIY